MKDRENRAPWPVARIPSCILAFVIVLAVAVFHPGPVTGALENHTVAKPPLDTYRPDGKHAVTIYDRNGQTVDPEMAAGFVVANSASSEELCLVLTLDMNIQHMAERELGEAIKRSQAEGGIALVMKPQTGEVLALAKYPARNTGEGGRPVCFMPGPIFTLFPLAAAIEEKLITPSDILDCEKGTCTVDGNTVRDLRPYGNLSVGEALKYASNVAMAKIGLQLGNRRLADYLQLFGFDECPGGNPPGQPFLKVQGSAKWREADLVAISTGQGLPISSLQLASAVSAIANGGCLMRPYFADRISDAQGRVLQQYLPKTLHRVISLETASTMTKMMQAVTEQDGTGSLARLEHYTVAGKTGHNASRWDFHAKQYAGTRRTASFVGFVPAGQPALTILVVIDEPQTSRYGGLVAAPVFRNIALQALDYLKISPPRDADGGNPLLQRSLGSLSGQPKGLGGG